MTRRVDPRQGFTLLEVIIAISVLSVGVLAAAGLQASGLQGSRVANQMQSLHSEARSELDAWRANLTTTTYMSPQDGACLTSSARCSIEIRPCVMLGGELDCTPSQASAPVAQALFVTVADGSRSVSLRTVVVGGLR